MTVHSLSHIKGPSGPFFTWRWPLFVSGAIYP